MRGFLIGLFVILSYGFVVSSSPTTIPIVLWHGMGDCCCAAQQATGKLLKLLNNELPDTYITSIDIGDSCQDQSENSYFMQVNQQIEEACEKIKADPQLQNGFNAIGFSQGGQFLRGLIQKCSTAKVHNLITLGSQHQGVHNLPHCPNLAASKCGYIQKLVSKLAYKKWVQKFSVQASYWHDPNNEVAYRKNSMFLADINNENDVNNEYIKNLQRLNKFVMVKFANDDVVIPLESGWFGWYRSGPQRVIVPLNQTDIYEKDRLGLKEMDRDGKLVFLEQDGGHVEVDDEWFNENILKNYLI